MKSEKMYLCQMLLLNKTSVCVSVCGRRVGCKQIHNKPVSSAANSSAFLYYPTLVFEWCF